MYKSVVYEGGRLLGEVEVYPQTHLQNAIVGQQFRISHFSQPSERCPPLAVLHTIAFSGVSLKMECNAQSPDSLLYLLHSSCFKENKTAVVSLGREELHLVAMPSRRSGGKCPCFWGFITSTGHYNSCLDLLNIRCLGIVFDLDETLVVANTSRSFEDRIEALQRKINTETDPQRIIGMVAEVKRYQEDRIILKQYADNDHVVEDGKVIKSTAEAVPALSDSHQPITRPLIRLHDKNIILTRINPQIRDTSVLVRLRPAWEDLRSYLTAGGRKRFEVYVCTMAERDYALEMWRLLDPELKLINSKELLDRIVCVKSGLRKSLFNVFQDGSCHPKMALVIDDRLKVWDEKDQPRVHVVPAFAPYYAPQAEGNNAVPILCVARNVACNIRGGFFREFDESLLPQISDVMYEDDYKDMPSPPDVSNYLFSEDDSLALNTTKDHNSADGMVDSEVERRLKEATTSSALPIMTSNLDPRLTPLQYAFTSSSVSVPPALPGTFMPFQNKPLQQVTTVIQPLSQTAPPKASLRQCSPAREEGEVPESELDPDTRRRLLILQHGQDIRDQSSSDPQFLGKPPVPISPPQVQPRGGWFGVEEEMSPRPMNRMGPQKEFPLNPEAVHWPPPPPPPPPPFLQKDRSVPSDRVLDNRTYPNEIVKREDRFRANHVYSGYNSFPGEEVSLGRSSFDTEPAQVGMTEKTSAQTLQDIADKCGTKVEFRSALASTVDLQFAFEVLFAGEKIGEGIGRTRREALRNASEESLMNLSDRYLSRSKSDCSSLHADGSRFSGSSDMNTYRHQTLPAENLPAFSSSTDPRLDSSKRSMGSVTVLKEFVSEKAFGNLKSTFGKFPHKRQGSPGSFQGKQRKRFKQDYTPQFMQRIGPSSRFPKNTYVP
ncbi:RNA polymerase II C-terminal domain phosphatase-like 1 [Impatiens glandulifera]|uniref:RNA polymerase II C-terminal domain phosphatase-like 1 n=1 Tax=Impatiens glandulifera TaxID=253017 RepID=UPI001FB0D528|nr:RNA polymerase II C-terminal domain phosphatase-like 1 [Impatiens glandulifera]